MYADVQTQNGIIRYTFDKNGRIQLQRKRASPRNEGFTENEVESNLIKKMNGSGFDDEKCESYQMLQTIFVNEKVTKEKALAIADLIAFLNNIRIPREYYRRRETVVFWLQEHWEETLNVFSNYPTTVTYKGKTRRIILPMADKGQQCDQHSTTQESQEVFQNFTGNDFFEGLNDDCQYPNGSSLDDTNENDIEFAGFDVLFYDN